MPVRELIPSETHLAYRPMLQLRSELGSVQEFVATVDDRQRPGGYRLAASFDDGEAASVAGFRQGHCLAWGEFVYIDDLVTLDSFRGRGHAIRLLEWIQEEARRIGCSQLHLDSGTHRHNAHRLYLNAGYRITGFHFATDVR